MEMNAPPGPADPVRVEPMTADHAAQVLAIYQAGIDEGDATFETRAPDWPEFDATRLPRHRFVAIGRIGAGGRIAAARSSPETTLPRISRMTGWH
jgi:L-amino acid N-acyltransferase YncA